jgi:hypothetical protein
MTPAGLKRNTPEATTEGVGKWWSTNSSRVPILALGLSVAIHLGLYWFLPHLGTAWRMLPEVIYTATLIPEPVAASSPPAPKPAARPHPSQRPAAKPARKTVPAQAAPPPPEAADTSEPGIESVAAASAAGPEPAISAPEAAAAKEEAQPPATQLQPETVSDQPPPVELPSRISLSFKASSSISDGVADYTWKRDGNRYETESSLQATGFFVNMFAGIMYQVSQGEVNPTGLKPEVFRFRRGEGEADIAEFLRPANELRLTRGGRAQTQPLPPNIQDTQSFLFQFAYEAAKLKATDDRLDVLVTNARKVYRHRFRVVGPETVETRFGAVATLHLRSEAIDPEDVYEVWLSPENYHLPVKLKFFAGRFPIELIATSIRSTP